MIQSRSISRELALLVLGQVSDHEKNNFLKSSIDSLLQKALEALSQYLREELDSCASQLSVAHQELLDSELQELDSTSFANVRNHLNSGLSEAEQVLNGLSASLELPRLLAMADQDEIRIGATKRIALVLEQRFELDQKIDGVMEGWRLYRLPRIDRDILRLAAVDLIDLHIPPAVAFNEAVDLANRYSDDQGRRMINGVLRRLLNSVLKEGV